MRQGSIVRRSIFPAAAVGLLLLGSLLDPAHAQSTTPAALTALKFRQSFIPTESYIPDEVALHKKFYEQQGLAVEMLRSTGGGNAASLVGAGNDQVGVAGAADVLIARSKGLDLVGIGINIPVDPTAIISLPGGTDRASKARL